MWCKFLASKAKSESRRLEVAMFRGWWCAVAVLMKEGIVVVDDTLVNYCLVATINAINDVCWLPNHKGFQSMTSGFYSKSGWSIFCKPWSGTDETGRKFFSFFNEGHVFVDELPGASKFPYERKDHFRIF